MVYVVRSSATFGISLSIQSKTTGNLATCSHVLEASAPGDYTGARRSRFFSRQVNIQSDQTGMLFLRTRFSIPLRFLQLAAAIILFIACLNLGNLFLAKAVSRRREVAVQTAIGATRWDIVRPHLIESLLLSTVGALVGISIACPAAAFLIRTAWTGFVSIPLKPSIDVPVLGFTALICIIS
jgi:putative ABC transport system permease protein